MYSMEIYVGDNGNAFGVGNPWFIVRSSGGVELLIDTPNDPSRFPPVYEQEYIIITHLHGDHISGLKRIVEYRRYRENKTTTIICPEQLKRNIEVLLDYGGKGLVERDGLGYRLISLPLGKEYKVGTLKLKLRLAVHTVPAVGVIISEGDKRILISGDHYYDPEYLRELLETGKISGVELRELEDWNFDLIFHDVGSPPYHTPIENLRKLPEEIRRKIVLYHTNEKFPDFESVKVGEVYRV